MTRGSRPRAARSAANAASARSSTVRSRMGSWIASSARSVAPLAMRRSGSASVTALIAWAAATHSSMPPADRSLVNAKPMRCESMTRMPTPRSPWTRTFSIAASFTSTDVDADSRKNTSARAPWRRSEPIARSTTASFVSRSLTRFAPCSSNGLWPLPRSGLVGFGRRGEAAPPSCLHLPADHDRGDPQRRLCVGDGRALPVLAAGAGRVAEVPAHHVDLAHELRPLPDEGRSAQRLGQAPVADAVRLGHLEREVPADDVDLAAAHLPDEDAVVDRREDVRGVALAWRDHRVRHPADRQVPERLTPSVPALRDAELLRVLPVAHVAAQHPVLDEDRAVRLRPFVIHRGRAALARVRAVVDDRDQRARDLLADLARVHAHPLQVQVGLEPVTDGFVDEGAPRLARQDDGVRAGGRRLGGDVLYCAPRRGARAVLDRLLGHRLEAARAAHGLEPGLEHLALLRDDDEREIRAHARVRAVPAIAVGDDDLLDALGVIDRDLVHPGVGRARDLVRAAQERHLS